MRREKGVDWWPRNGFQWIRRNDRYWDIHPSPGQKSQDDDQEDRQEHEHARAIPGVSRRLVLVKNLTQLMLPGQAASQTDNKQKEADIEEDAPVEPSANKFEAPPGNGSHPRSKKHHDQTIQRLGQRERGKDFVGTCNPFEVFG